MTFKELRSLFDEHTDFKIRLCYNEPGKQQILYCCAGSELPKNIGNSEVASILTDDPKQNKNGRAIISVVLSYKSRKKSTVESGWPKHVPFYGKSEHYANNHGETMAYRVSCEQDIECKEAIEMAIVSRFPGTEFRQEAVQSIARRFGSERVAYLLANTIQKLVLQGKKQSFSIENREWANTITIELDWSVERGDRNYWLILDVPPKEINLFVKKYRQLNG